MEAHCLVLAGVLRVNPLWEDIASVNSGSHVMGGVGRMGVEASLPGKQVSVHS